MEWYTKYLSIFGLTLSEIPGDTLSEIGTLLHEKQSDTPLVSVVVIAHNEEPHILSCLWSLGNNEYSYPIEILVVNNHSTDRTEQALQAVGATYFNELKGTRICPTVWSGPCKGDIIFALTPIPCIRHTISTPMCGT